MNKYNNPKYNPPGYVPTETEHKAAYRKMWLERILDDLTLIKLLRQNRIEPRNGPKTVEDCLEKFDKMFTKWEENPDVDIWEAIYPYEEFEKASIAALNDFHEGSCICDPCACFRCYNEELYDIPSSVTWHKCDFYLTEESKCEECRKEKL
jgi:hypothetical protein